jgi:hypothetical protein
MIKELGTYIATELSLTIGTDLYVGYRPTNGAQDNCLAVLERSGATGNFYMPDKKDVPIQFVTRNTDYHAARAQAEQVLQMFHGQSGIDLPVLTSGELHHISTAELISGPYWMGKDTQERHEFSINILFRIQQGG